MPIARTDNAIGALIDCRRFAQLLLAQARLLLDLLPAGSVYRRQIIFHALRRRVNKGFVKQAFSPAAMRARWVSASALTMPRTAAISPPGVGW